MLPSPRSMSSMHEYVADAPRRSSPLPQMMQLVMVGLDPRKAQTPPVPAPRSSSTAIVQLAIVGEEPTRSI